MTLLHDIVLAVRLLLKDLRFAAVAVPALALGIGASSMFFTLVDVICLRGLPIPGVERVFFVETRDRDNRPSGMSLPEYRDLRSAPLDATVGAYASAQLTLNDATRAAERISGAYASANVFTILGELPARGRGLVANDDVAGAPPVVVLSDRLWKIRFGGALDVIGQSTLVNETPATIVGVMGPGFRYPGNTDAWLSISQMPGAESMARNRRTLTVIGRLASGSSLERVASALAALWQDWSSEDPAMTRGLQLAAVRINDRFNGRITDPVWLAFTTVGALVLLIACANVANLLLMRAVARTHEISIRMSLGAPRLRLIRQLLVESAVLAVPAATLGLVLAQLSVALLFSIVPADTFPYWMDYGINARVLVALLLITSSSIFLFGLTPALRLTRADKTTSLQSGRGTTGQQRSHRWTSAFLAMEFALTLVLLSAVSLGIRQAQRVDDSEFQIDGTLVQSSWLTLPVGTYADAGARRSFYESLLQSLGDASPPIDAAIATAIPSGGGAVHQLEVAGRREVTGQPSPTVVVVGVSSRYFAVLDIPFLRGQTFFETVDTSVADPVVVNERFVEQFLPGQEPIGQTIRVTSSATPATAWRRIVGVVPTVRQRSAGEQPDPVVYVPYSVDAPTTAVILGRSIDSRNLAMTVRRTVARLDPSLPMYRAMTLGESMMMARWNGRVSERLLNAVGGISFLLAVVGLYAVTAHAVGERRRELGIRVALGARPSAISRLLLGRVLRQLAAGLVLGIACCYTFDRFIAQTSGNPVTMTDAAVLFPTVVAIIVIASAASLIPALRASWLDPAPAIRAE